MAQFQYSADPLIAPQPSAGGPADGKIILRIRTGGTRNEFVIRPGEPFEVSDTDTESLAALRGDPKYTEI